VTTFDLRAGARVVRLGERPVLMGVVNASPDSFSDGDRFATLEARVQWARELVAAGADIVDIGGESGVTNRPAVAPEEEIDRVVPLVERVAGELGAVVSVDTYKAPVARAAIAAGAAIVNDSSGMIDAEIASVCAETGAALVITYNRAAPKEKLLDRRWDGRMVSDGLAFLDARMEAALGRGVAAEQILLDPGPDFGKTPAQTVEVLRALRSFHALGRPLLLAVSRKDFLGVVTGRSPAERGAATLAALSHGLDAGAHVLRVHDVAAAADFVAVRAVLRGEAGVAPDARLGDPLRREGGR
jgi:dihydropteroate synthase